MAADEAGKHVRVAADRLNVRGGPSTESPVVGSVSRGQTLMRLAEEAGWVQVQLPDGTVGWVAARYVEEAAAAPEAPGGREPEGAAPEPAAGPKREPAAAEGGGSGFLALLKWGCLAGAGATGFMAYSERAKGNDAYDEYKSLARAGETAAAERKFSETEDHDGKALVSAAVAASLFAAFLLQQFVLRGGDDTRTSLSFEAPALALIDPRSGAIRSTLIRMRF